MEECKSPEAEALVADAVRGPNQTASAAARVEAEAHAAVAAVQAGVDARRAEAAVQAESEGRSAAAAPAAATASSATAALSLLSLSPAVSETAGVTSGEALHWHGQVSGEFARIDGDVFRLKSTMDQLLASSKPCRMRWLVAHLKLRTLRPCSSSSWTTLPISSRPRGAVGTRGSAMSKSRS